MIRYDFPEMNVDEEVTFKAIPDEIFDEEMQKLDTNLNKKALDNNISENKSIEIAKEFVCISLNEQGKTRVLNK